MNRGLQSLSLHAPLIPIITIWRTLPHSVHKPSLHRNSWQKKTGWVSVEIVGYVVNVCVHVCAHVRTCERKREHLSNRREGPSDLHYKHISHKSANMFACECQAISGWAPAKWDSMFLYISAVMWWCCVRACTCTCAHHPSRLSYFTKIQFLYQTESADSLGKRSNIDL